MTSFREFSASFSSAHFYEQPAWSVEKNAAEFGRCFTKYGHGHNYNLKVTFQVEDSATEIISQLRQAVLEEADRLDHVHLNFMIQEFKKVVPTTENIALYFWQRLQNRKLSAPLAGLRLYETHDLWVEITP